MRYIQSMGTFGFANQLYKSALRFYYGASKDVSLNHFTFKFTLYQHTPSSSQSTSSKPTRMEHSLRYACTEVCVHAIMVH